MLFSEAAARLKAHKPQIMDIKRANAVLIPLVETDEGVCLLFEQRAENIMQPGEICFPGGGIEAGESSEEAAVRETMEELGVGRNDIELISQFDTRLSLGGFIVYSYAAKLDISRIAIDRQEVADYFLVPLDWFINNPPQEFHFTMDAGVPADFDMSVFGVQGHYAWRKNSYDIAVWNYEGRHIWGITAGIIKSFVKVML